MISDELLSRDSLEHDEWTITPKPEHLVPDSIERERTRESFRSDLGDDPSTVVLTHIDADGYSSAALVADYRGPDTIVLPMSYHDAYGLRDALGDLAGEITADTTVYIVDLAANDRHIEAHLLPLEQAGVDVVWYDHHQWDEDARDAVERAGVTLVVDEDECAASLLARDLGQHYDSGGIPADFDPYLEDLAECTKDIDLWIRDDPRSERLNVFASLVDDPSEYISAVLDHGADLPTSIQKRIDERLERDRDLEQAALENRTSYRVGRYDVAITYVRGGRSSQIGNDLVEEMDHDIAIIQKPHGGVGVYSHSDRETFACCHEVANQLGGGGHPTAAGCEVPAETFRDLADYWKTAGASVRDDLLEAVMAVVKEDGDSQ
jgi:oligoribonuclease NrnB/cAMP/cGMP phosphodiesterase (DHH superfamily)